MTTGRMIGAGLCLLIVSGCGVRERLFGSDVQRAAALPYEARLARGKDRRNFVVTLRASGVALEEARESLRFPATRYCIESYGGSPINWDLDPETGDWAAQISENGIAVSGRCITR